MGGDTKQVLAKDETWSLGGDLSRWEDSLEVALPDSIAK